jgi:hypothetical protein
LTEGERHAGVQEVSTTAKQSRPGVDELKGEEEVRGRRGCQGEPRRGRIRCRGMARLGVCRRSAEPRWNMKIARKTMKITEPESKPNNQAIMPNEFCIVLCIEVVEGGWINAPPIS